jgi:glycosyltransferase involved in cell wall biosynthesis
MPELYMCKFGYERRHLMIRLITWMEKCSIGFAHKAVAVHAPHLQALVAHGNDRQKFAEILNVPDPRIFQRNGSVRDDGKFRLIYHGTIARRHGLEVAVKAVHAVKQRIPNLEFWIIGRGDDLDTDELNLRDCIRFLGTMPTGQLPHYLQQADVGVVPLLYDPFTRYMLPVKLLEYVGMGIPCIVSETETIRAYFTGDMVRYCKPGDEQDLAAAIVELYQDPSHRRRLVTNASKFNDSYNWDRQRKSYFELVDSLLPASRN